MQFFIETPWDVPPDNSSTYQILAADDQWLFGNGIDPIQKYDNLLIKALGGNAPKGNILIVYKGRLMVAGDPSFPHRIWYSHQRNAEGWTRETDWIDVYPQDGGKINGLDIEDDELIVSKNNNRTYGWRIYSDGVPENSLLRIIEDNKGRVSTRAGTTLDKIHYYLDRHGQNTIPDSGAADLSYIVNEIIDAIDPSVLATLAMGGHNGKVYTSIGDVTFDAGGEITIQDGVLIYDTINKGYYLRDNMDAKVFTRFSQTGQDEIYFGDSNGRVFQIDDGTMAGSNSMTMLIRTKPYFKDSEQNVSVSKVGVMMLEPDGTTVNSRIREEEGYVRRLGIVEKQPIQWFDADGEEGPFYELQFTHNGQTARPALLGFIIVYSIKGRKEDAK